MDSFSIRPAAKEDRNWVAKYLDEHWGSTRIVSRGQVYLAHLLPGFIAEKDEERVGLVTFRIEDSSCEIMTLNSELPNQGVATALLETVKNSLIEEGIVKRIWVITTNDNMHALRFYQKRGFTLSALYPRALDNSRKLKPEIPLFGLDGIPLRDEIELEMLI
ncbi:MAG: GNAT family N-acetyltransferase [Anaerolineae bacterium]|nr:GNAT family N-acetyltransferase [Anaerolineae bacterium]